MRIFITLATLFLLSTLVSGQSRGEALNEFNKLKQNAAALEKLVLSPDNSDMDAAAKENARVFRIMPREKYDNSFSSIRGGGSFYSFVRNTHEYGRGSDIALEQGHLSVGFAGRDYGFFVDLGETSLSDGLGNTAIEFLKQYNSTEHAKAQAQARSSEGYKLNGFAYKYRAPATVGHTYALRSINVPESDVLVAFRILRKDADGSMIIIWRLIEDFSKPADTSAAGKLTR